MSVPLLPESGIGIEYHSVTLEEENSSPSLTPLIVITPPPTPTKSQEEGNISFRIQSLINNTRENVSVLDPIQLHIQLNNLPYTKSRLREAFKKEIR